MTITSHMTTQKSRRVGFKGTCEQCGRQDQWIRLNRCASCRKGYAEAAATTKDLKPKENSKDWVHSWKPLNERAEDKLLLQSELGIVALETDEP